MDRLGDRPAAQVVAKTAAPCVYSHTLSASNSLEKKNRENTVLPQQEQTETP